MAVVWDVAEAALAPKVLRFVAVWMLILTALVSLILFAIPLDEVVEAFVSYTPAVVPGLLALAFQTLGLTILAYTLAFAIRMLRKDVRWPWTSKLNPRFRRRP